MTWNSGGMIGGATHWPRLNRAGFWTRPDPAGELVDDQDLTDGGTVDSPETDGGETDEGTQQRRRPDVR